MTPYYVMQRISIALLLTILWAPSFLNAQEASVENIKATKFKGVKSMDGAGFYVSYMEEKATKQYRNFAFEVFDNDLNQIKKTTIPIWVAAKSIDGAYNGENFIAGFIEKQMAIKLAVFDTKGNLVKTKIVGQMNAAAWEEETLQPKLFSAGKKGFFIVTNIKEKKWGYSVELLDKELNTVWRKKYVPEKGVAMVWEAESSDELLAIVQTTRASLMSRKSVIELVVFDNKSGDLIFTKLLQGDGTVKLPSSILVEKDAVCLGGIFFAGDKMKSNNSDGVFFSKYSRSGEEVFKMQEFWASGLQKKINAEATNAKGLLASQPKAMLHTIVREGDTYYMLGELFKKAASGKGLALGALGGSDPGANISSLDFIILNIDAGNGELRNIFLSPKDKNTIWVPSAYGSGLALAYYAKRYNLFSYRFMEKSVEGENNIIYFNWGSGDPYIGIAMLGKDEVPVRKVALKKKAVKRGESSAVRSKPGQVLVYQYSKKEKKVTMWLEDL